MSSEDEPGKPGRADLSSGRLLNDIEEISKALYLHKIPPKGLHSPLEHQHDSVGDTQISDLKSKVVVRDLLQKDKKSSMWNWKPLKALTHLRNHRFNCRFFLHVHAIEGLSQNFSDLSLFVTWKRKEEVLRTHPARVCQGTADFEETLTHQCSIFGSRSGPQHSAKYEPKLFLLHASVVGAPALDIGKHWIDLTRLLPLTLEELEEGRRSSGKWTTGFKLTGKAKGAMLNVSFGFSVVGNNPDELSNFAKAPDLINFCQSAGADYFVDSHRRSTTGMLRRLGSISNSSPGSHIPSRSLDVKAFEEVLGDPGSELFQSISLLYQKLDEGKLGNMKVFDFEHEEPSKPADGSLPLSKTDNVANENENFEFTVSEHGIELPANKELEAEVGHFPSSDDASIETVDISEIFEERWETFNEKTDCTLEEEATGDSRGEKVMDDWIYKANDGGSKELTAEELESIFMHLLDVETSEPVPSPDMSTPMSPQDYRNTKSRYKAGTKARSLSLDDVAESVANDFLSMLGIEDSPIETVSDTWVDSPREHLLRQFENECTASGKSISYLDMAEEQMEFKSVAPTGCGRMACADDFDLSLAFQEAQEDYSCRTKSLRSRRNAKMLENLETEALMKEWGLNEKAFLNSPCSSGGGFGSPIFLSPEQPLELPPLGEGLGPVLPIRSGGFLQSMSSSLFRNAKNGARLIMQVSDSVVLPAAMGSSLLEVLQCWASEGVENMSSQAKQLMPLEDITGKMMQQLAWEAESTSEMNLRWTVLESSTRHDLFGKRRKHGDFCCSKSFDDLDVEADYVSLEDLAPLAMDKIEALSIEGLRIQSSMSDYQAPAQIRPHGRLNTSSGSNVRQSDALSYKGTINLQVGNARESDNDTDDLTELCISLDEWMSLDAGDFSNEQLNTLPLLKILAVHHAKSVDLSCLRLRRDHEPVKLLDGDYGLLNDNFRLALRVQLRDPLRNFEIVGASMLVLILIERMYTTFTQEIKSTDSERNSCSEEHNPSEQFVHEGTHVKEEDTGNNEKIVCRFKISEVHLAGLNFGTDDNQIWTSRREQQAGVRWLLSNGMAKNKGPYSKTNAIIKPSAQIMRKVQHGNLLWSISSHIHATAAKWKELAALNIHVRNPDIMFLD